jgi:hypothetical protein
MISPTLAGRAELLEAGGVDAGEDLDLSVDFSGRENADELERSAAAAAAGTGSAAR